MASLTRVCIMGNSNVINMPPLYKKYPIVYINDEEYSIELGGQEGSQYFLLDDGEIYGQIKGHFDLYFKFRLYDIDSQLNSNEKLHNSLLNLKKYQIVKVGEFEIQKIVLFGKNNTNFSIKGIPILYNNYIIDEETDKLQKKIMSNL